MPSGFTVQFDRDAAADLIGIRDHVASARGQEFADAFVERIIRYCESLSTVPHRGTKRDAIRPGLRTVGWRRTITIAFQVDDAQTRVSILGIFYRGRDTLAVLKERTGA